MCVEVKIDLNVITSFTEPPIEKRLMKMVCLHICAVVVIMLFTTPIVNWTIFLNFMHKKSGKNTITKIRRNSSKDMEGTTKTLKDIVFDYLTNYPVLRDNDNMLIARVIKDTYGMSDLYDIALATSNNIYMTITRYRRKIQEENPMLASSQAVQKKRALYEEKVKEEMRCI